MMCQTDSGWLIASAEERLAGSQAVLEVLDADLSRLLRQKYHMFWSHVIFDPRLLRLIDSFLRYARRAFDGNGGDAGSSPALDPQSTYFSVFVKVFKGNILLPATAYLKFSVPLPR
jgi:hypothetical protein